MIKRLNEHIGAPKITYIFILLVCSTIFYLLMNFVFSSIQYSIIKGATIPREANFLQYIPKKNFFDMIFYSFCLFTPVYVFLSTLILSIIISVVFTKFLYKMLNNKCERLKGKNVNSNVIIKDLSERNYKIIPIILLVLLCFSIFSIYVATIFNSGHDTYGQVNAITYDNFDSISNEYQSKYSDETQIKYDFMTGKLQDERLCYEVRLFDDNKSFINSLKRSSDVVVLVIFIGIILFLFYLSSVGANRDGKYCPICHKKGAIPNRGTIINQEKIDYVTTRKEKEVHTEKRKWDVDDKWHKLKIEEDVANTYHVTGSKTTYEYVCSHCGQTFQHTCVVESQEKI